MAHENQMDQGPAVPPQVAKDAERGVTNAREAAEDLRSATGAIANEYQSRAEGVWDDTLHRVRSFQDDSKQYVRENPTKAVFTALGGRFRPRFNFPSLSQSRENRRISLVLRNSSSEFANEQRGTETFPDRIKLCEGP